MVYQRVGYRRIPLIFLFVVVLVVPPQLWAQVSFTPDIEGYAELAWGIASEDGSAGALKHGFKTTTDFKIVFPIVAKKDFKYRGEGNVYAEINVEALKLSLESNGGAKFETKGSVKTIEATLHCYGAYLTIGKNPDFKSTFAVLWEPWTANGDYKSRGDKPVYEPGFEGAGGKLGYKQTDIGGTGLTFDIAFKFASNTDWEGKDSQGKAPAGANHSKYGLGGDILFGWERTREDGGTEYIKVELTGDSTLSGDYALPRAPDILWDVGAKVSMKLWGMCALVATDVGHKRNARAAAPAADALLTLGYRWFSAGGYFASKASNVFKDVFLARNMDMQTHDCATYIKLETKSGDPYTHLLTGLNAGVEARVYMPVHYKVLTGPQAQAAAGVDINFPVYGKVWGSYCHDMGEYGWVKVYANLYGGTNKKAAAAAPAPGTKWSKEYCGYYECGVVVSPLEKVEVRLSWEQGKLQENSNVVIEKNVTERWQFVGACRLIW
uniref:TprK n=1 Tax=Treponema paraluiscuniculi TaxID=53435 RepID=Q68KE8_9SPIR|nr:TprK [Treponema paraluiscuniculi]